MPKPATDRLRYALSLVTWGLAAGTSAAAAQLPNQSFEVVPQVTRATVGDSIPLRLRVRLDITDLLYDTVPQPVAALPEGVSLRVEKLHREPDRSMMGRAVVVFFRPGRQAVPVLGLPFMRGVKGLTRGMLPSDSAFVEIVPVAPPGNPELKDIREPFERQGPDWRLAAGALAAAGVAIVELLRRRQGARPHVATASTAPVPAVPPDPYHEAVRRLREIEQSGWASDGELARRYGAIADVIRVYLKEAHGIPAPQRTSGELLRALPPTLTPDGLGTRLTTLLTEADRIKFARARPEAAAADQAIQSARLLLDAWNAGDRLPRALPAS